MEQLRGSLTRGGADGGDAQTESGTEEGLRWRKTGEVDTWAIGDECVALGRGRTRRTACAGENFRPAGGGSVLRGAAGRGARRGGRRVDAEREREGGLGVAWSSTAAWRRHGSGPTTMRATVEGGGIGTTRTAWLTGGPGRNGGRSSAAGCDVR
jgi:hypothetical protein